MLKYWRIWLLLIMVFGALLAIGLKPQYSGVQVIYVTDQSPAKLALQQGMIISEVNGEKITNADEWDRVTKDLRGNITLVVDRNTYQFFVNETENLGINVINLERTNLNFGLDIRGGTRVLLKPKENATKGVIDQVIGTLQTRANAYGLREITFRPVSDVSGNYYVEIEAAGVGREVVTELLSKQGKFEAKITKPIEIKDGVGTFQLGFEKYQVSVSENDSVKIGNITVQLNQTFTLKDIDFEYLNKTQDELIFLGTAYKGEDIELVYSDPQHSGVIPQGNSFMFYFVVLVSQKGSEKFADITSGIPSRMDLQSGEYYLRDSWILLYLDDKLVSNLRIAADLGGKAYTTPQIQGGEANRDDAIQEQMRLQTILRSGALPVGLETESVSVISPTLGSGFIISAFYAAILAGVAVIIVVFIRYRSLKIAIPMALTSFTEVVILMGIASSGDTIIWVSILALNVILLSLAWWKKHEIDVTAWFGALLIPILGFLSWTIDLPSMGGMIAAIGVGVDNMIVIADETLAGKLKERMFSLKERFKRAFFIIFGASATIIAAMVPFTLVEAS